MVKFIRISKIMIKGFRGYYAKMVGAFMLSLLAIIISIFFSLANQTTIDQVIYEKNINYLLHFMIYIIIGISIISLLLNILNGYVVSKINSEIDSNFKIKFYQKTLSSSFYFHNTHESSDIYYRMFNDLSYIINFYLTLFINIPVYLIYSICTLTIMFYWSKILSLIFLGVMLMDITIITLIKKPIYNINASQRTIEQNLIMKITNDLTKILTIKVFGIEKFQVNKMKENFQSYIKINVKNKFLLSLLSVLSNLSSQIWSILLLVVGAIFVFNGNLTVGKFISFSSLASATMSNTSQLINLFFNYQIAKLSYDRVNEYENQIENKEYGGTKKFSLNQELHISNLTFAYSNANAIFKDFNMKIKKGNIVAIIGENGKGKTTLINQIDRLLIPTSGQILFDTQNIQDIQYSDFRNHVGYVLQRPIIFHDTVFNNVILDQHNIRMNEVIHVLEDLGIYDEIKSSPKKLNTVIGEDGYQLSVGNMQKIALARVFVRDYKVLLLDEPTSSLDIESQQRFLTLIQQYKNKQEATILLITHRESEINIADDKIYL